VNIQVRSTRPLTCTTFVFLSYIQCNWQWKIDNWQWKTIWCVKATNLIVNY